MNDEILIPCRWRKESTQPRECMYVYLGVGWFNCQTEDLNNEFLGPLKGIQ